MDFSRIKKYDLFFSDNFKKLILTHFINLLYRELNLLINVFKWFLFTFKHIYINNFYECVVLTFLEFKIKILF